MSAMNCDRRLLALTLWPEWAWAIVNLDKRTENRTWTPDGRLQPGDWLAIHAGAAIGGRAGRAATREGFAALAEMAEAAGWSPQLAQWVTPERMTRSAIVGLARYDGWDHRQHTGWDVEGCVHWRFSEVKALTKPVPCKGSQGLWHVRGDVLTRVREQWRAA